MASMTDSLMKKKKAELVNIILRKDDVEKELRSKMTEFEGKCTSLTNVRDGLLHDIALYKNEITELNEQLGKKNKLIAELNEDCDIMRDNVTILQERVAKANLKMFILGVAITTIATAIIWGINLFM